MEAQRRIKTLLGEMQFQLIVSQVQIEARDAEIARLKKDE